MLIRSLNILLAGIAIGALGGCSTPCDAPGRLCAPIQANTREASAPAAPVRASQPPPAVASVAAGVSVQTMPVEQPDSGQPGAAPGARAPVRIGLMLPLRSETLGPPAEALRAGFMAAWERERDGFTVNLIETGDSIDETLRAYAEAARQNDIVVGPLARPAVGAVAASALVAKPTIALNHPELRAAGNVRMPPQMLVMGLSIEDEARQVASWAHAEQPAAQALIVSGASSWQRRIASAFAAQWSRLGRVAQVVELPDSNGYLSEAAINQLRARMDGEAARPALVFGALGAEQVRQLRAALGADLPWYGTSSVNPGSEPGSALADFEGLRLLDLPWQVNPGHPAVMVYPRWSAERRTLDMDRLYALGIDAFRVAREIALHPASNFKMDGVTGRLSVSFGLGAPRFERTEPAAVVQDGAFKLVGDGR